MNDTFADLQEATDAWKREIEEVKRLKKIIEELEAELKKWRSGELNTEL